MTRAGPGTRPWAALAAAACVLGPGLAAQEKKELDPDQDKVQEPWGKIVHYVHVLPPSIEREPVIRQLKTKKDLPLKKQDLREDLYNLYYLRKHRTKAYYRLDEKQETVEVFFEITQTKHYERVGFQGMEHLDENEARILGGITRSQRVSEDDSELLRLLLLDRYRTDGFYFANIERRADDVTRTVTYFVDEGPRVRVRSLHFRGNVSYPGDIPLGYGENLEGSAKLESLPPDFFWGNPFSLYKVEDDIEKVELFYRREGYLDAQVHLEEMTFSPDQSRVDLTFRVDEGRRYRVVAVDLQTRRSTDPADTRPPLYEESRLLQEVKLRPGDFYTAEAVRIDRAELTRFYGKRGHPTRRRYGQDLQNAFDVLDPMLTFHPTEPEVSVVYRLVEGEPKRLREVRIFGNATTQDRVVRRRIRVLPGDILDVEKLERSQQLLDNTQYFRDPRTLSGVRLNLKPVPGQEEEVDLEVFVQEGETGNFTWGAGVSTGSGVQGNIQFNKRNFDLTKLPSSWNPGVWFSEIASGKAFHGGDQEFEVRFAPGTQESLFRIRWQDPDILRQHIDTIGMRVDGYRTLRYLDSYRADQLGALVRVSRNFDDRTSVSLEIKDETVELEDVEPNAPLIVFQSERQTEIRSLQLGVVVADLDSPQHPRSGYRVYTYGLVAGGALGASEDFSQLGTSLDVYTPFQEDALERKHVIFSSLRFDLAEPFGSTDVIYPSERWFMGGSNLRGFDQRRAGPSQFGQPVGGEARLLSTLEYQFPLVSTQMEGATRQTEIIRGVLFSDFGLLGLTIDHPTFQEPRLSVGFGVRILVPVLQVPIQLDLAWPLLYEETDRREQLYFSFQRF